MGAKTRVVLFCGGSFNPITHMHLRMFELARDYLNRTGQYHVIGGVVSPVNDAYGKKDLIPAKHRCQMIDLALKSSDWIRLDCWETDQDCWLTTVKVLAHHQRCFDMISNSHNEPGSMNKRQKLDNLNYTISNTSPTYKTWDLSQPSKIMLLCGGDLLESFSVPGLWADEDITTLLEKHGIVVITRQGTNPQQFIYESDLLSNHQSNIHIATEWISNEISSTRIRRALRRSESVKYLVPDSVLQYIKDHCLYQLNNKYMLLDNIGDINIPPESYYETGLLPPAGYSNKVCDDMLIGNEQETAV